MRAKLLQRQNMRMSSRFRRPLNLINGRRFLKIRLMGIQGVKLKSLPLFTDTLKCDKINIILNWVVVRVRRRRGQQRPGIEQEGKCIYAD